MATSDVMFHVFETNNSEITATSTSVLGRLGYYLLPVI